jgi:DNA adenine methylase
MFPYPGGKSKISKWIIPHFPSTPIETYVEPFGGAFWTYFKWSELPQRVVYNDLNVHLVNFFECARSNPAKLASMLKQFTSEDRETFEAMRTALFTKHNGLQWTGKRPTYSVATIFAYLLTHHFIGHQLTPTLRYQHIDTTRWGSRYKTLIKKLEDVKFLGRLRGITNTENLDFRELITKYDTETTFFYIDPPYWNTEHYYSEGDFNEVDHRALATQLSTTKGKFALSYYDFEELAELYPKDRYTWYTKEFTAPMSAGAALAREQSGHGKHVDLAKHKATEVLITNY